MSTTMSTGLAIRHDASTDVPTTLGRIEVFLLEFCHVPRLVTYDD
jgi:hypothetical protein